MLQIHCLSKNCLVCYTIFDEICLLDHTIVVYIRHRGVYEPWFTEICYLWSAWNNKKFSNYSKWFLSRNGWLEHGKRMKIFLGVGLAFAGQVVVALPGDWCRNPSDFWYCPNEVWKRWKRNLWLLEEVLRGIRSASSSRTTGHKSRSACKVWKIEIYRQAWVLIYYDF